MRALSDALPTGHRAMANPTRQLHFGCGRATPPVSHSHNWPSGRMKNFLFKIGQKSYFFANKDPKTKFDDWMILQKHVLSFKCNDFFKMANLKAISSSATLSRCVLLHDDVIKWKHFPRYWPFVRGIHRSPVNSPHKGQWRGALMFSLICVWINGWVNNRKAGDLRRYRAHYDVTVMTRSLSVHHVYRNLASDQSGKSSKKNQLYTWNVVDKKIRSVI